jgi:hypothetical protein
MATFCVCSRCGNVQETDDLDQLPKSWLRSPSNSYYCSRCVNKASHAAEEVGDVLDEKVIYRAGEGSASEDTLDEEFCEVCTGQCRGH